MSSFGPMIAFDAFKKRIGSFGSHARVSSASAAVVHSDTDDLARTIDRRADPLPFDCNLRQRRLSEEVARVFEPASCQECCVDVAAERRKVADFTELVEPTEPLVPKGPNPQ